MSVPGYFGAPYRPVTSTTGTGLFPPAQVLPRESLGDMAWQGVRKAGVKVEVRPTWVDLSAPSSSKHHDASDVALASPEFWRRLHRGDERGGEAGPTYVSIEVPMDRRLVRSAAKEHLIVEVRPAKAAAGDGPSLHVPQHLLLPSVITPFVTRVRLHKPIEISLAILQPTSPLHDTQDAQSAKSTWIEQSVTTRLLRQGGSLHLSNQSTDQARSYTVALLEPVRQGIVSASTRIIVTATPPALPTRLVSDGHSESSSHASLDDFDPDTFLSTSLSMHTRSHSPLNASFLGNYDLAASSYSSTSGSLTPRPPGSDVARAPSPAVPFEDLLTERDAGYARFTAVPAKGPGPTQSGDEICWLGVAGLGRAGIFEGDWILVRGLDPRRPGAARLMKAMAWERLDEATEDLPGNPIMMYPSVYRSLADGTSAALEVALIPTPFGARQPTLPIAKTLTLARIATAEGADKRYERSWLRGIKRHFVARSPYGEKSSKMLKRGDVIAVPVSVGPPLVEGEDQDEDYEIWDSDADSEPSRPAAAAVVYFVVTSLSFDPLVPLEEDFQASITSQARAGEMGCWADVGEERQTRLVLMGMERDRLGGRGMDSTWLSIASPPQPYSAAAIGRLRPLLTTAFSGSSISAILPPSILIKGNRGSGKVALVSSLAGELGLNVISIDGQDLVGDSSAAEGTILAQLDKCKACAPSILLITHIEVLARRTETSASGRPPYIAKILEDALATLRTCTQETGFPCILVGTTVDADSTPGELLGLFKQEISLDAPSEIERHEILRRAFDGRALSPEVDLHTLARESAAFQAADLQSLVLRAVDLSLERAMRTTSAHLQDVISAGVIVQQVDVKQALDEARAAYADSIGAPKIPNVGWDDIGGLAEVKKDILDTIQLPMDHPELFSSGLKKRSGILLYGPPGTGKTLLAKAVATSCSLNFFSVKGPELLNMYVGESEANVRRIFQRARDAAPCVIFMDELDSVAPKRGNQGDSGGVMDRIVSQLLAELDGVAGGSGGQVFVMGATNRPDLLDPALLRPGRFDRLVYLSPPRTVKERSDILIALTRKFKLHPQLDLASVAEQCPPNLTGADLYALAADAMLKSMTRLAEAVDGKIATLNARPPPYDFPHPLTPQYYLSKLASPDEMDVVVGEADFDMALQGLKPSVSQAEMKHYERVQRDFDGLSLGQSKEKQANGH